MRFSENFDSVFCSCELGYKKPQREVYEKIVKILDIENPQEILYFDDAEENTESAKKL